jgi:hypothetical protein
MKKIILATVIAFSFSALAQTEAPASATTDPSPVKGAIQKTNEKMDLKSEKHKSHHAGKKSHGKKHKKSHGKKHKKSTH